MGLRSVGWCLCFPQDAFPLELETFPKLASLGSYSIGSYRYEPAALKATTRAFCSDSFHHHTYTRVCSMTYTVQEQKDIVEFARLRGVRIVLELDLPGHADIWALGAPAGAFVQCSDPGEAQFKRAYLDVTSPAAYTFYDQLLSEITSRFPDHVIHLGGDEVGTACWNSSASVQAWLKDHSEITLEELYPRHMLKAYQLASKHNRIGQAWGPSLSAALNYSVNGTEPDRGASVL
eukprot:COSAG02_NODE_605_length_19635_cov_7.106982_11_plen_234_part_00